MSETTESEPSGRTAGQTETPVILIEGEFGTARQLTDEVRRELDERNIPYTSVSGTRLAGRELVLPAVIAPIGSSGRQVTYQGYSRICLDFLARFTPR